MSSMRRETVSFDKGTFDIPLSAATPNTDLTICLQAGKIKEYHLLGYDAV
jgi:hypothetical protein